jgi:hypothetical protein
MLIIPKILCRKGTGKPFQRVSSGESPGYPEAVCVLKQLLIVPGDIVTLDGNAPSHVSECASWKLVTKRAKHDLCKVLKGKTLLSAMYGIYTVTFIADVFVAGPKKFQDPSCEEFREQRRRKSYNTTGDEGLAIKKKHAQISAFPQKAPVPTKNYFAPLRTKMDYTESVVEGTSFASTGIQQGQEVPTTKAGRSPPNVLTSIVKLMNQ